jgi:hypothetical protein
METKEPRLPQEGENQPAEAAVLEVLLATGSSSTGSVPGYQQVLGLLAGGTGTSTRTGTGSTAVSEGWLGQGKIESFR